MTIFLVASLQARLLYAKRPKKSRQEPCFLAVCGCAGANAGDGRCAAGRPQGSPLRRNTSGLRCRGGYQPPAVIPCPGFRVDQGIDPYGVQRASSSVGEGLAPSRQQRGQGTDLPRRNRRNAGRAAGRPQGSPLRCAPCVILRRGRSRTVRAGKPTNCGCAGANMRDERRAASVEADALDVPLSLPPLQGEVVLSRLRRKTGGVTPQSPP